MHNEGFLFFWPRNLISSLSEPWIRFNAFLMAVCWKIFILTCLLFYAAPAYTYQAWFPLHSNHAQTRLRHFFRNISSGSSLERHESANFSASFNRLSLILRCGRNALFLITEFFFVQERVTQSNCILIYGYNDNMLISLKPLKLHFITTIKEMLRLRQVLNWKIVRILTNTKQQWQNFMAKCIILDFCNLRSVHM